MSQPHVVLSMFKDVERGRRVDPRKIVKMLGLAKTFVTFVYVTEKSIMQHSHCTYFSEAEYETMLSLAHDRVGW